MDIQDAIRRIVREELAEHRKELERLKKNLKRNLERIAEILGARYEPNLSDSEEEDDRPRCMVCDQPLDRDVIYYDSGVCSDNCMRQAMDCGMCADCLICDRVHKVGIVSSCVFLKKK